MKRAREEPRNLKTSPAVANKAARIDSGGRNGSQNDVTTTRSASQASSKPNNRCPYLDTINRQLLDFDKPKLCSVTMSTENVYACLVCGTYFQGRGKGTRAWTHACQNAHHVFMKISGSGKGSIWCLPDNYEVVDESLRDIRFALEPTYSGCDISALDANKRLATDVQGVKYLPGFVGLNNVGHTDYINATVVAISHVTPVREFFLDRSNWIDSKVRLVHRFGELLARLWSTGNYRNAVSPHDFVQEVSTCSKRRFGIGRQEEVVNFMQWLLNTLAAGIMPRSPQPHGGSVTHGAGAWPTDENGLTTNPILRPFQGLVEVRSERRKKVTLADLERRQQSGSAGVEAESGEWETIVVPFLFLGIDLPPVPLFKDSQGGNVIPQVPFFTVMNKYDGETVTDRMVRGERVRKRYTLKRLPDILVCHFARFTKNNFFREKNPTIVNFPVKNLEMKRYLFADANDPALFPPDSQISKMGVGALKAVLNRHGVSATGCIEKADLVSRLRTEVLSRKQASGSTKFDLLANICHDSPADMERQDVKADPLKEGSYRVHVRNKGIDQWYEIEDLHVEETLPQLIALSESYLAMYERKVS